MNIVNIYGKQEGRSTNENIEKSWLHLYDDIKIIEDRGKNVMIVGDLNRAVGNDEWGIIGNNRKVSKGGKFLRELIKTGDFTILNNLDKSDKGPWTWIDRKDNNTKSCLDIAIASMALVPHVVNFEVDRERKFTPRRVIRKKNMITEIFTDHFSLKIELSGMPKNKNESKPVARWNVNKPGGWLIYERITDEILDKINSIVDNDKITIDEAIKRIDTLEIM